MKSRRYYLFSVFVGLFILTGSLNAMDWGTIAEKAEAKFSSINDMKLVQTLIAMEEAKEVTIKTMVMTKGEKFRMEMDMPVAQMPPGMEGMKTIVINDGENVWSITPFTGKTKVPEDQDMYSRRMDWIHWWGSEDYHGMRYVRAEKVNGRDAYLFEKAEGDEVKVWIDKSTLIPIKGVDVDEDEVTSIIFKDFRSVDGGWEFPFKQEIFSDDELIADVTIESIDINKGISDEMFDPDKVEMPSMNMEMMKK